MGIRFLHPVWFVGDVVMSCDKPDSPHCKRAVAHLEALGLSSMHGSPNTEPRRLTLSEIKYIVESRRLQQEKCVEEETGVDSSQPSLAPLPGAVCSICLDAPCSIIFIPCGHYVTCSDCANKLFRIPHPTCVICRTGLDKLLPLRR